MEVAQQREIILIPPAIIDLISRTNALYDILLSRDFEYMHRFLRSLLDNGVISPDTYDELCMDLAELIGSRDGFEEKAKRFAEKVLNALANNNRVGVLSALRIRDFETVHRFLRSLLDNGVISPDTYDELCMDLAELISSRDGFEEKAKKFAEKIGGIIYG